MRGTIVEFVGENGRPTYGIRRGGFFGKIPSLYRYLDLHDVRITDPDYNWRSVNDRFFCCCASPDLALVLRIKQYSKSRLAPVDYGCVVDLTKLIDLKKEN